MSCTVTSSSCQEPQVYLVNIMSVAEQRLQKNFQQIFRICKNHDALLTKNSKFIQILASESRQFQEKQSKMSMQRFLQFQNAIEQSIKNKIGKVQDKICQVQGKLIKKIDDHASYSQNQRRQLCMQLDELRLRYDNDAQLLQKKIQQINQEVYKAYQEIYKKQDSVQAMKMLKDLETVRQKNKIIETSHKAIQHKIETIQILNERSQRAQSKKQTQIMKQIEEKIKKQVKNIQKVMKNITPMVSENREGSSDNITPQILSKTIFKQQQQRMSLNVQQQEGETINKSSLQRLAINKLNDRFSVIENKTKTLQDSIKQIKESKKVKKNNEVDDKIKQKIEQIRPEIIKIWAKCDALDDRIVFAERRSEQRNKIVNNLLETQKQNNWGRMDEKLKLFQTQIYGILKDVKTKIDTKMNSADYQKYCTVIQDKLKQIMQLVYLKSDKLQVKKALLFLQSKIKQIILVISEDQQQEKDALLTKKQLKCISCDKDIEKMSKVCATSRGNWDGLPMKDHSPELLGRFGMTNFGSLSKKLKKLQSKDLPVLQKKRNAPLSDKENV